MPLQGETCHVGPVLLPGHSPCFPGWTCTWEQEHQPLGGSDPAEAKTLSLPADHLLPAGPGCPRPQLPPGFQWGQLRLPAAASGTATAGGKRWIVPLRVPGTNPGMAVEVCLRVSSPCSLFWVSHAPHPAPPPFHGAPVPVRVASGWSSSPFWGIFSSYLPNDRRIKATWLDGNRSTARKPQTVALLQAHPCSLRLAPTMHASRHTV